MPTPRQRRRAANVGDMRRLGTWDKRLSSLIILSVSWEFFDYNVFTGTQMAQLGPGLYPHLPADHR